MKRARGTGKKASTQGKKKFAKQMGTFYAARAAQPKSGRGINSTSVFQPSRRNELKSVDVSTAGVISQAGNGSTGPFFLNPVAQGIDINQHIGRELTMKSLYWLWQGELPATTTGGGPVRLVIVYDKESEGAAPTAAAGAQTDAFNLDTFMAQMNLNNRDRFIVLVDEIVETLHASGPSTFFRKGYKKMSLPVVYNAAGATIASVNTGGIYAFCWSSGTYGVAAPTSNLQTRIRFEDA